MQYVCTYQVSTAFKFHDDDILIKHEIRLIGIRRFQPHTHCTYKQTVNRYASMIWGKKENEHFLLNFKLSLNECGE